jgi:hypothetical protein
MSTDYIPRSDAEFDRWQQSLVAQLGKDKARFNVADATLTTLADAQAKWANALAEHNNAQADADTKLQAKNTARREYEGLLRAQAQQLQNAPHTTDADRAAFGLTISTGRRTAAPAPTTRPVAVVDTSHRLRHTISFSDEETPNSRRKPDGVRGCELWVKVGDPAPTDPAELRFLALDTATPYVAEYDGADAGKTAHYMLRWTSTRGEAGPWSQTVSATITG